jgi:hypothetical protein
MALSILKAGAIAATALILSATSSMAAVYGYIDHDNTKVKKYWSSNSSTVWVLDEGDYVKVINYTSNNGGWYKVDPPGANNAGWVKDTWIDIDADDFDDDDSDVDLTICGPTLFFGGNFCINTN